MKTTVQNVMNATLALTQIINIPRQMSQKGKYRVARMHAKLKPEFDVIDARRDEMIKVYNTPKTKIVTLPETGAVAEVPTDGWKVPEDKMPEFTAAWKLVGDEEIEVDVEPIPLSLLSLGDNVDGAVEAHELVGLGDFVTQD